MKKLFLSLLMLAFMAGGAQAAGDLNSHSYTIGVGYSTVSFVVDTADPDSAVKKIVLFRGTTRASMVRLDSLTTVTDPDTLAITGLIQGTTYYWYVQIIDSTTTIYEPSDKSGYSVTTTDLPQTTTASSVGYSTVNIIVDSVVAAGLGLDSVRLDIDKTDGTTYSASITTVTVPEDTFAVASLDENATYYYRTIVFLTDSSAADTLTAANFTTKNLQYSVSVIRSPIDSLIIKVDTLVAELALDSLIFQWGAGLAAITNTADTITSVTEPDTFIVVGLIEGGTYYYRLLAFLADSSAIETTTVTTYTRPHNSFVENVRFEWPGNFRTFLHWDFDSHTDTYSTGIIPITSPWLRIHVTIDGEDDFATSDSINVFFWSHEFGDSTAIDTLVTIDPDTITITPLKYRMYPGELTDSSMTYFPEWDWGTHYSVSASMSNDDGQGDSTTTLGVRSVHVVIEERQ